MSRYIKDIRLEQPIDVVSMVMEDFVYHNHFTRTDWNGEMVFYLKDSHKKERYMKWTYVDGQFHVEAWLKTSLGGEMDLDGVGGGASRKEFRASMDRLIETLKKTAAGSLAGGHVGSDPLHHDNGYANNHDTWRADTQWQQGAASQTKSTAQQVQSTARQGEIYRAQSAGQRNQGMPGGNLYGTVQNQNNIPGTAVNPEAKSATIYAVLALIFGGMFPILGVLFIVLARRKIEYSSNPGLVKVLCILAIVVMVLGFAGNILITALGLLG